MKRSYLVAAGLLTAALALFTVDSLPAASAVADAPAASRVAQLDPAGASESEAATDAAIAGESNDSAAQQAASGDESSAPSGEAPPAIDWNIVVNPAYILMMLGLNVIVAELLSRHTVFRHFGTTMTVLVTTAIAANLGLMPTSSAEAPIYKGISDYVAPLSIFWLLLAVNLRDVMKAGLPMILMFLIGSLGTCVGVIAGMWCLGGPEAFGDAFRGIGGTFVGTYTGGAANFTAVGKHYHLDDNPIIFAGMNAVDAIYTLVWMIVTYAVPRTLAGIYRDRRDLPQDEAGLKEQITGVEEDTETVHPLDLAFIITAGAGTLWFSDFLAAVIQVKLGINIPSILILTSIALLIAQIPAARVLTRGSQLLGMFGMYLFLATIGAHCDVVAIIGIGQLAISLAIFTGIVVGVHGLITFGGAALLRIDLDVAAVASQANIGGATTALGLARSLGRRDLSLPGILVGSLGYAIGTYLGIFVAEYLL